MEAVANHQAHNLPRLPDKWHAVAQFA